MKIFNDVEFKKYLFKIFIARPFIDYIKPFCHLASHINYVITRPKQKMKCPFKSRKIVLFYLDYPSPPERLVDR